MPLCPAYRSHTGHIHTGHIHTGHIHTEHSYTGLAITLPPMFTLPSSPHAVAQSLTEHGYLPDEGLATVVYLSMTMSRPLFLEGDAGVGKTELAKVLAAWTGGQFIRLQCYEGIDSSQSLYEWDYTRQLLHLRTAEAAGVATGNAAMLEDELYSERFLIKRPLLQALDNQNPASEKTASQAPAVLLIDEVDRADDEFEAFLLEVLSDFEVTVPELGTISAKQPPNVIITSNRTRDVHDALKRRCLYHWVPHPTLEREVEIVKMKLPDVDGSLARQVAAAVAAMRDLHLYKSPGVAETIDWATALGQLGITQLDEDALKATLGTVLKYREDQQRATNVGLEAILAAVGKA